MKKLFFHVFLMLSVSLSFLAVSCENSEEPLPEKPLKIGILLSIDEEKSVFRVCYDGETLTKALVADGYDCAYKYSRGNVDAELKNLAAFIADGVKVLIYSYVNEASSAETVRIAKDAGMKVICYSQLARGVDNNDFFVTFDNVKIGEMMGEYLVHAIPAGSSGKPLYIYTGNKLDYNSVSFFKGSWSALRTKIADGTFIVQNSPKAVEYKNIASLTDSQIYEIIDETTTNWNSDYAADCVENDLGLSADIGTVYVLAPNDQGALAMIPEFKEAPHNGIPVITGQDGWPDALNAIIKGQQTMTLLKSLTAVLPIAKLFADRKTPTLSDYKTVNNGTAEIPTLYADSILIDSVQDIRDAIVSGYINAKDVVLP